MAINLILAMGKPTCREPLVSMVSTAHYKERFRWIGAKKAMVCAGLEAVPDIIKAFPAGKQVSYEEINLNDALWTPVAAMEPKAEVAEVARTLLTSSSWVGKVTGMKVLEKLALKESAADDALHIAKLERDRSVLRGWWGDQSDLPRKERKRDPTLGKIAREVRGQLEELAKSTQK